MGSTMPSAGVGRFGFHRVRKEGMGEEIQGEIG
jgi:hypothetical protein